MNNLQLHNEIEHLALDAGQLHGVGMAISDAMEGSANAPEMYFPALDALNDLLYKQKLEEMGKKMNM